MYVVVVGAGRIGRSLIELALKDGHDVAVFDVDEERAGEVAKAFDVVAYHADATQEDNLWDADVDRAAVVFATTRKDPVNLMVVTLAHRLGVPKRVSVVNQAEAAPLFVAKGAQVVGNPSRVAAEHLLYAARHHGVTHHVAVTEHVDLFQVSVSPNAPLAGVPLKDAALPPGVIIAAVERNGAFVFPRADTVIHAGDFVSVLAHQDLVGPVLSQLRGGGGRRGR